MKKRWVIAALLLILLGSAWPWGRDAFHSWRQRRLLAQATDYLQHDQFNEALFTARLAASLDPPSADACRLVAQLLESIRSPDAIAWREKVVALQPQLLNNRFDLARTALSLQHFQVAEKSLAAIPISSRETVEFHRTAAALALATNNSVAAGLHLRQAVRWARGDPVPAFNLAVFQLDSTDSSVARAAADTLENIPARSFLRVAALRSLLSYHAALRDLAEARKFSSELLAHPGSVFDDRMIHLNLLHTLADPSCSSFLAETQRAANTNAVAIFTLSSWMIAHDQARAAFEWLGRLPPSVRTRNPVPLALADCQLALGLWADLLRQLPGQNWRAMDFVRLAFLSRALREQNFHSDSRAAWQNALRNAGIRPDSLRSLQDIASAWNWENETLEVLRVLVKNHPREIWAVRRLHDLSVSRRDSATLCDLFQWLSDGAPADLSLKNNFIRLSLLLPRDLPRAHELAAEIHRLHPENPDVTVTCAYSLHLQGRTDDALHLIEALPAPALDHPLIANYRALFLAATGQFDQARLSLRTCEVPAYPEEETLFAQTRAILAR